MASRTGVMSIALSLLSLTGNPCRAQNVAVPTPPRASSLAPVTACKTPATLSSVPGFTLACGRRIPTGIFLGSVISPAADSIGDCAARCTANANCLAFSLDNRDAPANRVCTLFGSIESFTDALGWVTGVRVTGKLVIPPNTNSYNIDLELARGRAGTKTPTIALGPTTDHSLIRNPGNILGSTRVVTGSGSVLSGNIFHGTGPAGGYFTGYATSLNHKTAADITGKRDLPDLPSIAPSANPSDSKKPATIDSPFIPTSDMKDVQPVYFATDRAHTGGPLQEASFTDTPAMDVTYGYVIVSIPKSHVLGNVERPQWSWLKLSTPPESDAKDFRIKMLNGLGRDAFVSQLKADKDSVLLFIHGYNVSFSDAVFKAAQIAYDANFGGSVLVFSWPSAGSLLKYDKDRESAEFAAPHLVQLFHLVMEEIGKKNVYIVAHSMGNEILVNALQQAALSNANVTISELVMAAPDVDTNVFRSKADQIRAVAKNITLYASSADKALLASGAKSFGTRLGFVGATGPNVFPGIETIDVTAVGDDMLGLDHSTFSSSRAVLDDLGHLIRSLTHVEPDARTPTLKFMPDKAHVQYWLYPR